MTINLKNYNPTTLIIIILLLSVVFGFVEYKLLMFKTPVAMFSIVTFIGACLWLINSYLWRYPPFSWVLKMPNLNGRYNGGLISSYKNIETGNNVIKEVVVEIKHNFSTISINMYFAAEIGNATTSSSKSQLEEIYIGNDDFYWISFTYFNEPDRTTSLDKHFGTCMLKYFPEDRRLEGGYFNDRGNKGEIKVGFENNKLKGYF